jgi:hypothetical protein
MLSNGPQLSGSQKPRGLVKRQRSAFPAAIHCYVCFRHPDNRVGDKSPLGNAPIAERDPGGPVLIARRGSHTCTAPGEQPAVESGSIYIGKPAPGTITDNPPKL